MPLATWKDLIVDAVDPAELGPFWADTLGLRLQRRADGMTLLTGPTPQHTVWINQVPEPVTVKQRVHLDVHAAAVEDVLARGASPLDLESFDWSVLRDPEGGELCVFEPRDAQSEMPAYRLMEIVIDCARPREIATWWAGLLGGSLKEDADEGWAWIEEIAGLPFKSMVFVAVPEPKTVKNRIHWDVDTPDIDALLEAGARQVRAPDDDIRWWVMADPEGNEFCAFLPEERG